MHSKSIFTKFFSASAFGTVMSSLIMMSLVLFFVSGYVYSERQTQLQGNIRTIAAVAQSKYITTGINPLDVRLEYSFQDIIDGFSVNMDATLMVVNRSGELLMLRDSHSSINQDSIPQKYMDAILAMPDGSVFTHVGAMDGFFNSLQFVAAYPLKSQNGMFSVGAVFMSMPNTGYTGLFRDISRIVFFSALAGLFINFFVSYLITRRVVMPVRRMSRAAAEFAQGNFNVRVPVRSGDETGELAVAFNNMAEELSRLENMRRDFLSDISHELKTPMTVISGFMDGMLDGTIPPDRREHYMTIVRDEVLRLSRLVNALLEVARIQSGAKKAELLPFDICETIRKIIIGFEKAASDKNINMELRLPGEMLMVTGSADDTHRVVYNIMENAVKFCDEGGNITISLEVLGKKAVVRIRNTGLGIPKEDIPFVFERFYKTDKSRSLDKGGMGLGLYLVKRLVEHTGERIWVESEHGRYCEFCFTIAL